MNHRQATLHFCTGFWVPEEELPCGTSLAARRHMAATQDSGCLVELSGGDEHPSGEASQIDSILTCFVFCDDYEWGKLKF